MRYGSKCLLVGLTAIFQIFTPLAAMAVPVDLVVNGGFENNGGTGQINGTISYASGWTLTVAQNPESEGFAFILDANADSQGFESIFFAERNTNIYVWGPNTPAAKGGPVNNGFNGPYAGNYMLGIDGDYGQSSVSQTITGLTVGEQYLLTFAWAQSQFTDAIETTTSGWTVTFGSDVVTTGEPSLPGKGFSGWNVFSQTFTAQNSSQILSFLAEGGPVGQPPFVLLDAVSLTPVPEPSTVIMGGLAMLAMGLMSRRKSSAKARRAAI